LQLIGSIYEYEVTIEMDETTARRVAERFSKCREVTVKVTQTNALEKYLVYSYVPSRLNPAVAVQKWKLDECQLIEDWVINPKGF
jgi:hypothetical protein